MFESKTGESDTEKQQQEEEYPEIGVTADLKTVSETKTLSIQSLAPFEEQLKGTPTVKPKTPYSRTPSGNSLTGQVRGIREFLQDKSSSEYSNRIQKDLNLQEPVDHDKGAIGACAQQNCEQITQAWQSLIKINSNHDDEREVDNIQKKRKHVQSPETVEVQSHPADQSVKESKEQKKRYKMSTIKEANYSLDDFIKQYGINENAGVLDVRTVLQMFNNLTADRKEMAEKIER